MSLGANLLCRKRIQVLQCAAVASLEERDLIRECLDHAKTCKDCQHYIKKDWGSVEELEKYLELKAWPEYDSINANQEKAKQ